jgi:hypothetical protein
MLVWDRISGRVQLSQHPAILVQKSYVNTEYYVPGISISLTPYYSTTLTPSSLGTTVLSFTTPTTQNIIMIEDRRAQDIHKLYLNYISDQTTKVNSAVGKAKAREQVHV